MIDSGKQTAAKRRCRSADGMTLIEVMVVVAVSTLLMGTIVSLLIALKQADRNLRRAQLKSAQLIELAEAIRIDIRRATAVSLLENNKLVVTSAGGRQRRYELDARGCARSSVLPGEATAGREFYAIGPADSWTINEGARGRNPLYLVTLNRPASDTDTPSRRMPLLVCAALGADLPAAANLAPGR